MTLGKLGERLGQPGMRADARVLAVLDQRGDDRPGCCQTDANRSPLGSLTPRSDLPQAASDCHSTKAAERRSSQVLRSMR